MEIGRVLGNLGQRVIDLPVDDGLRIRVTILERKAGARRNGISQ